MVGTERYALLSNGVIGLSTSKLIFTISASTPRAFKIVTHVRLNHLRARAFLAERCFHFCIERSAFRCIMQVSIASVLEITTHDEQQRTLWLRLALIWIVHKQFLLGLVRSFGLSLRLGLCFGLKLLLFGCSKVYTFCGFRWENRGSGTKLIEPSTVDTVVRIRSVYEYLSPRRGKQDMLIAAP